MKCYGYTAKKDELLELTEVTIQGDASSLRRLADFIRSCAERMEAHEDDWEHEHFGDSAFGEGLEYGTDIAVYQSK